MRRLALSGILLLAAAGAAEAQSAAARRLAKEVVEALESRFAREVAEEGVERVETRLAMAIERYGDDAARAARRVGPRIALEAVEKHGAAAGSLLSKFGDDGARLLASEGDLALKAHRALGDEGIALLLRRHGTPTGALLPKLAEPIAASGRKAELLAVIEKYGDRACNFLWRNKGVIFGAAALAAFLADPEPYLDGVKSIVGEPVRDVAVEAAKRTNWTLVVLAVVGIAGLLIGIRVLRRPKAA